MCLLQVTIYFPLLFPPRARNQTQGLAHARQVLYHRATPTPSPLFFLYFYLVNNKHYYNKDINLAPYDQLETGCSGTAVKKESRDWNVRSILAHQARQQCS